MDLTHNWIIYIIDSDKEPQSWITVEEKLLDAYGHQPGKAWSGQRQEQRRS